MLNKIKDKMVYFCVFVCGDDEDIQAAVDISEEQNAKILGERNPIARLIVWVRIPYFWRCCSKRIIVSCAKNRNVGLSILDEFISRRWGVYI